MFNNILRIAVTSAKEVEHPFDGRPLYTNADDSSPNQLFRNLFSESPHHLDYTVCMVLIIFCCGEVILLKILLAIAEEGVLVAAIRRQHHLRRRWFQIQHTFSGGQNSAIQNTIGNASSSYNAFDAETVSAFHSTSSTTSSGQ